MATLATRTVGGLLAEARDMINDVVPISGAPRFQDADLLQIFNEALLQIRTKRPDAWLTYGLRKPMPLYTTEHLTQKLPIEDQFYTPLLYYLVGRAEMVEDTFADNGRAITLMNKFTSQLLAVAS